MRRKGEKGKKEKKGNQIIIIIIIIIIKYQEQLGRELVVAVGRVVLCKDKELIEKTS